MNSTSKTTDVIIDLGEGGVPVDRVKIISPMSIATAS